MIPMMTMSLVGDCRDFLNPSINNFFWNLVGVLTTFRMIILLLMLRVREGLHHIDTTVLKTIMLGLFDVDGSEKVCPHPPVPAPCSRMHTQVHR
jgi:hypothetical protein